LTLKSSPTQVRYIVVAFLCALSFLTYFDRVCIMQAQHDIQRDLHLTDEQLGLVLGAFWLAYALFEIPGGWLGDRFGTRATLTRIVIAWSLFTGLSGAANGFVLLLMFRFCFGAGEAGAYPNMAKVQQAWLPVATRARAGGLLWLSARWGGALSPLIFAGLLAALGSAAFRHAVASRPVIAWLAHVSPWRIAFWLSGTVGLLWVLLFYRWFRDDPSGKPTVNQAELDLINDGRAPAEQPTASHRVEPRIWAALFASRSLWALAVLSICAGFGWNFFVSWLPKYFEQVHRVKFENSPLVSGMPLFFGGISCLIGGWLSDQLVRATRWRRWGRACFPIFGYATAATAIFCVRFTHSYSAAVVLVCLTGAATDFGHGANWAAIINIGGRYAGMSTGFINSVGNLGNSAQGFIGAVIFTHYGWGPLFAVYAATYLIAGSMWFFIDPCTRFYPDTAPAAFDVILTPQHAR
jgi:ACS family glucarate transporter-like MFS transporter